MQPLQSSLAVSHPSTNCGPPYLAPQYLTSLATQVASIKIGSPSHNPRLSPSNPRLLLPKLSPHLFHPQHPPLVCLYPDLPPKQPLPPLRFPLPNQLLTLISPTFASAAANGTEESVSIAWPEGNRRNPAPRNDTWLLPAAAEPAGKCSPETYLSGRVGRIPRRKRTNKQM